MVFGLQRIGSYSDFPGIQGQTTKQLMAYLLRPLDPFYRLWYHGVHIRDTCGSGFKVSLRHRMVCLSFLAYLSPAIQHQGRTSFHPSFDLNIYISLCRTLRLSYPLWTLGVSTTAFYLRAILT
jgi:hypothetical protein